MDVAELLARNVRRFRDERGLSLGALARRAGVSKQTLSMLERGLGNPTVLTVNALCDALEVSPQLMLAEWGTGVRVRHLEDLVARPRGKAWCTELDEVYGYGWVRTLTVRIRRVDGPIVHDPEPMGTLQQVYVIRGRLRIALAGKPDELVAGEFIRFPADSTHSYRALTDVTDLHVTTTTPHVPQLQVRDEDDAATSPPR